MSVNKGILVNNLLPSQLNNILLSKDITVFTRDNLIPTSNKVSVFGLYELNYFHGSLITFDLDNTDYAIKTHGAFDVIFYVWDLEWLRNKKNFIENVKIYRSVKLYCRSKSHQIAIEQYCNIKPEIKDLSWI